MPAIKLYLPYGTFHRGTSSLADSQHAFSRHVTFHWFCIERPEPIAPYASLIMGHHGLTPEARTRAEQMVDEFFSEEEFHQFRDYMQTQHQDDLRTTVLSAPVHAVKPDTSTRAGSFRPFRAGVEDSIPGSGFCKLAEEEGYSLPFSVWGYYIPAAAQSYLPAPALAAR